MSMGLLTAIKTYMARTKKAPEEEIVVEEAPKEAIPTKIELLSVDYANEGLNNMARKINEIILKQNG
jgi:hypothetical protein